MIPAAQFAQGRRLRTLAVRCGLAAAALFAASGALAQSWPAKPIRMVVPLAAGGTGDALGRIVADRLAESLGQQVVVENRAGANGIIGVELVVKAPPDGYTLLTGSTGSIANSPGLYGAKLPFDPVRDLAPVTQVANTTSILLVHPSLPVANVRELVALAKARPGQLDYSSAGSGSTPHLNCVLFASMAGIRMNHIPYKGSTPGRVAVAAGEVSVMIDGLLPSLPLIRTGKVRALGVTSVKRSPVVPDVPAIAETVPGYAADIWYGVLAPAALPAELVARLNAAIAKGLAEPAMRKRLADQGAEPVGSTPQEFGAFIRAEIAKWGKVIRDSGARVD